MWLEAIITREDLVQLLGEVLPVKIHFDDDDSTDRWLWLGRADEVTLVPEDGLRVVCPAELRWSIAGMSPTVKFNALGVLIRPEVVEKNKGNVLEFSLEVEETDIRGLPGLIDATVAKAVNGALATRRLTWNFTETLTHLVSLPKTFEPIEALKIGVAWGKRRVGAEALVLVVSFHLGFVRGD